MENKEKEVVENMSSEDQYKLFVEQTAETILNTIFILNKELKEKVSLNKTLNDIADNVHESIKQINEAAKE